MVLTIQRDVSLLPYNTFQIDVKAKYFVEISTLEELQELFATDIFQQEKKLILGGGANVLFTGDVEGLVVKVGLRGITPLTKGGGSEATGGSELEGTSWRTSPLDPIPSDTPPVRQDETKSEGGQQYVRVAAGENWSDFVEYANEQGRAGIENLIAIPGSVGAAPVSNIGAYGVEIGNRVAWVEGYDLQTWEFKKFSHEECRFAYRSSVFKFDLRNQFLVTHVVFALEQFDEGYVFNLEYPDIKEALTKSPLPPFPAAYAGRGTKGGTLKHISQTIAEIRASKLPDWEKIGTAGSFFANPIVDIQHFETLQKEYPEMPFWTTPSPFGDSPWQGSRKEAVKLSAGWLIEKAGLKGYSNGKAGTSPKHALIVINEWGSAADVLEVVERIQDQVFVKFGVRLVPEVVIVE